jgi:hypothetical protein
MKKHARPSSQLPTLLVVMAGTVACATAGTTSTPNSAAQQGDVERVIDQMLAEERKALRARTKVRPEAPPVAMPEVAPGEAFREFEAPSTESADTFTQDVLRIQQVVPTWNNGTGIALKFLRESNNTRVSLIYVDPTPPVWQKEANHWMIRATAKTESSTLGHFVLQLKDLAPGHYRGSASEDSVVMGTSMAEDWDAEDPDTTWSRNHESWCEIVLLESDEKGVVEGQFRGKLIDNQGTGFHNIESGYLYIKQ